VRNALVQNDPPKYADVFALKDEPAMPSQAAALHAVVTVGSKMSRSTRRRLERTSRSPSAEAGRSVAKLARGFLRK